jgi:5'-nucleotidase (lipoprotein e(P4) family)
MRLKLSLLLVVVVLTSGCASGGRANQGGPGASRRDTHEELQGTLWMQTAAEYRVLAETTYRAAADAIPVALANPGWTAATEQTSDPSKLPPAVILDLDETVLDNSLLEGEQTLRRAPYTDALLNQWVALGRATLVPGAGEFLKSARGQGVAVFFVTNRTLDQKPATLKNLTDLGVQVKADEILANQENGWVTDKTSRRQYLAQRYRILLLLGDDLGDFIPSKLTPEKRVEAAESHSDWWGKRWFLLPNPLYGSWERALYDDGTPLTDEQVLARKFARVKGFHN